MKISFLSCLFSINLPLQLSHFSFSLANYAFFEYIENVWDFYVLNTFQEFTFYVVWLGATCMSHLLTREKYLWACLTSCHFKPAVPTSIQTSLGYVCIYALASCGYISNFHVLNSNLQIFNLHQVIESKDLGDQKRTGLPKLILK